MTMYRYDQTNDTLVQIESEDELLLPARPESRVTVVPYSQPLEAPVLPRTNVVYTDLIKPLQQARPTHEDHDGLSRGIHRLAVLSSLLLFPASFGLLGSLWAFSLVDYPSFGSFLATTTAVWGLLSILGLILVFAAFRRNTGPGVEHRRISAAENILLGQIASEERRFYSLLQAHKEMVYLQMGVRNE